MTRHTWTHVYTSHRHYYCSRHGFTYIRGWMKMVLAPNDLFSWNNNTISTMVIKVSTYYISCWLMHVNTHSVHNRFPKPWWGRLLCSFPSCHVTSSCLPCPNSTDAHWPQLGAPVPPPPKWHPLPQGQRTLPFQGPEQLFFFLLTLLPLSWQACRYRPFPSDTRRTAEYLTERKQNMDRRTAETWSEE